MNNKINNVDTMNILRKIPLFCSSYSFLIFIALLLKWDFNNLTCLKGIFIMVIFALIVLGYYFLYNDINNSSTGGDDHIICSVENKNDMMHTYLLPYLIFILTFVTTSPFGHPQILALSIFFAILFIVYISSDLFLFDITLIFLGYSYYKVTSKTNAFIVISNVNLYEKINKRLYFRLIDSNLFLYGD